MVRKGIALGAFLLAATAAAGAAKSTDLVVHEWGTFLAMEASDGVTLDGMYHEEHALPGFVHARSKDQLRLPSVFLKGETPVIYFYTRQRQRVRVEVQFPRGIWTQWYPQAAQVGPQIVSAGSPPQLRNGHISWNLDLVPDGRETLLPAAPRDALWNYARQVDAAYVKSVGRTGGGSRDEYERFIFYRGLGQAELPLQMSATEGGTLSQRTGTDTPLRHLFVLRVENGRGTYRYLPALAPGTPLRSVIPAMSGAMRLSEFSSKVADDLALRLQEAGLYAKEARAMVNTWRSSYFESDGIRVLFLLPQSWTDRFIPMELDPQPSELVRVMVGRMELLTPEREQRAAEAVRRLASSAAVEREEGFAYLRGQGRYVEPILRRVLRTSPDERLRALCRRLLLTEFVTELRSAVNDPATGRRINGGMPGMGGGDAPVFFRAQLASLLGEVGLTDEARKEGEAAMAGLRQVKQPAFTSASARHYLRGYARTLEPLGDDTATSQAYARFVRWGAQVKTCGGCHETEGPRDMAWFRDWWAGRRLVDYTRRSGRMSDVVTQYERELARNPDDAGAQMILAYLYAATGEKEKAERLWTGLDPSGRWRQVTSGLPSP